MSGIFKPLLLSDSLCEFLDLEKNTKETRQNVTKAIIKYVKDNDLQSKTDGRVILVDDRLTSLLKPGKETVTFFNLQKLINKHYH